MKVALGYNIQEGPWGGANLFAKSLYEYLIEQGEEVVFSLDDFDIDLILLTEPRRNLLSGAFSDYDVLDYLENINSEAVVIQRINDCDQRKEINHMNRRYIWANRCADYTVFIGEWLVPLYEKSGWVKRDYDIGLNGADQKVFYAKDSYNRDKGDKLKIITHHWGPNWLKGWDFYEYLDRLLDNEEWSQKFTFTYAGKLPKGFTFRNSVYKEPLSGDALANVIRDHDIYLTASQFEPAGMHHIEGAMCGLPLIYRDSGALPEYCKNHGVMFQDEKSFKDALLSVRQNYDSFSSNMRSYPHSGERMCRKYHKIFKEVYLQRDALLQKRDSRKFSNYIPFRGNVRIDIGTVENFLFNCTPTTDLDSLFLLKSFYVLESLTDRSFEQQKMKICFSLLSSFNIEGSNADEFGSFLNPSFLSAKLSENIWKRVKRVFRETGNRDKLKLTSWLGALLDRSYPLTKSLYFTAEYVESLISHGYKINDSLRQKLKSDLFKFEAWKLDLSNPQAVAVQLFYLSVASNLSNSDIHKSKLIAFIKSLYRGNGLFIYKGFSDYNNSLTVNAMICRSLSILEASELDEHSLIDAALWEIPQTDGYEFLNNLYVLYQVSKNSEYRKTDVEDYANYALALLHDHYCQNGGFSPTAFLEGAQRLEYQVDIKSTYQALEALSWVKEIKGVVL